MAHPVDWDGQGLSNTSSAGAAKLAACNTCCRGVWECALHAARPWSLPHHQDMSMVC
jgi:hypothetical protein